MFFFFFLRIFRGDVSTCSPFEVRQKIAAHRSRYEQAWTRSVLFPVALLLEQRFIYHSGQRAVCGFLHSFPGGEHFILTGYAGYAERERETGQTMMPKHSKHASFFFQCSPASSICICLNFMASIFLVSRDSPLLLLLLLSLSARQRATKKKIYPLSRLSRPPRDSIV